VKTSRHQGYERLRQLAALRAHPTFDDVRTDLRRARRTTLAVLTVTVAALLGGVAVLLSP
jgi:hypothetical protein